MPTPRRLCRRRPAVLLVFLFFISLYVFYAGNSMESGAGRFRLALSPEESGQAKSESKPYDQVLSDLQKPLLPMAYGTNARPPLKEIKTVIADLPPHLVPVTRAERKKAASSSGDSAPAAKRLIIVGDVHGMRAELEALLASVRFNREKGDHLILTGDLVNKGPDSAGVIALAMELGASAVRGNHDDRVLLSYAAALRPLTPVAVTQSNKEKQADGVGGEEDAGGVDDASATGDKSTAEVKDSLEQEPFSHGDAADRATAATLSAAQLEWLASLPVILRVGALPASDLGSVVVVHAGLAPGLELERQDPWAVMNMRTLKYPAEELRRLAAREKVEQQYKARANGKLTRVSSFAVEQELSRQRKLRDAAIRKGQPDPWAGDKDVALPISGHDGEPWSEAWDRWMQDKVPAEERVTVVFGHDAKKGLNEGRWSIGLDSGCVYGKKLSALVIEAGEHKITHKIVHVPCKEATKDMES